DLDRAVAGSAGRALQLTVSRAGDQQTIAVTPRRTTTRDPIFKEAREIWDLGAGPQLTPQIGSFIPGSAAERAGLRAGDLILEVGGQPVFTPEEITQAIQKRAGQPFEMTVQRGETRQRLSVTAVSVKEKNPTGGEVEVWRIGVNIVTKVVRYEPYGPLTAATEGVVKTWDMSVLTAKGLWKLAKLELSISNLGGPIQIATEGERQRREGLPSLAVFTAFISVNLAVLNLLPVPMLDGGHLLFFVIEGVLGRPLSLEQGVDGLRLNPGNIGGKGFVQEVVNVAKDKRIPIRIGVNGGSLEKDLLAKYNGPTAEGMVESALRHIRILEDLNYPEMKIS